MSVSTQRLLLLLRKRRFSPLSLAPAVWLKADAGTYQTSGGSVAVADGDNVGEWQDQSGNARHGSAAGTARPALKLNIQNGLPVIRFDNVDDVLALPNFLTAFTAGSIYAVVKQLSSAATNNALWKFGSFADDDYYAFGNGWLYQGFGSTVRYNAIVPTTSVRAFNVFSIQAAAGAWSCYLNGVQQSTSGTNTVGWTATPTIGKSLAVFGQLDFGEIVLNSRVLTAGEDANLLTYLRNRWGTP